MDDKLNVFNTKYISSICIHRFGCLQVVMLYCLSISMFLTDCINQGKDNNKTSENQEINHNATLKKTYTNSQLDSIMQLYIVKHFGGRADFNKPEYVGMSIALYYAGKEHYYNYGKTSLISNTLPNQFTSYEIGSITKVFTSLLLANAVVKHRLDMNSPITLYLPDSVRVNPFLKHITVKMLANHTSGLPRKQSNLQPNISNPLQQYEKYLEHDLFSYLKNYKSTHLSALNFQYSNVGYNLLGVILEKVYGKSYERLLKEYVTVPLMLKHTTADFTTMNVENMVKGYDSNNKPVEFWKQPLEGAGAIISSSSDLLQFGKYQLPSFKSSLSEAIKLTHQPTFSNGTDKVGLAWQYLSNTKDNAISHTGETAGCSSAILINLKESTVLVILANKIIPVSALGLDLISSFGLHHSSI